MVAARPEIKFTYEDYRNTREDERYELLDGELIMAAAPNMTHQRVIIRLGTRLHTFVEDRDLGESFHTPTDVVLSDTNVVQPDILYVSNERSHVITTDNIRGAPDLIVEILSPSTARYDRTLKRTLYARHGVREYWLADPYDKTVTVMLLGAGGFDVAAIYGEGDTLTSPTLEGLRLNLDEIF